MTKPGILYICPTPIGNLEDITLRVLRVLKEVDIIACEDTRVTQKLLNHYDIHTKLISYHKFSEKQKSEYILDLLKQGQNVALVSDAGTPLISDPGSELIKIVTANDIKIEPLPGASAITTILSASYNESSKFAFVGFLPKNKKEKEELLLKYSDINTVFYESPSRIVKTLEEISCILGDRVVTIGRELTKLYEEIKTDRVSNLIDYYSKNTPKGEIVCIIQGETKLISENITPEIENQIRILQNAGYSTKELSKILGLLTGISKSKIYDFALKM